MSELCRLKLNSNGSGYDPESVKELRTFIKDAFDNAITNSEFGTNAILLKNEIKKALYKIGDHYHNGQLEALSKYTKEVVQIMYGDALNDFFPEQGIKNAISKKFRNIGSKEITQESYNQEPEEDDAINQIASQFLDDFLGNKARLKNTLKQEVTHQLINTFIVNRELGKIVQNVQEANLNAIEYKQSLFDEIIKFFKENSSDEIRNLTLSLPENLKLFNDEGEYTNILHLTSVKNLTKYLDDFTPEKLQEIHDKNIDKYNIITKWFILNNFDNFINLLLGSAIVIKPGNKNFGNLESYSFATKSDNLLNTWRTTDNVILENEISKLAQSLINSTPFYKKGINVKTDKFIKFEDFYRIITKIKELPINEIAFSTIYNKYDLNQQDIFGDSLLSEKDKEILHNRSLASLINNIRTDPQTYLRLVFRVLNRQSTNKNSYSGIMSDLGFTTEEQDKCYSIYKGFFDQTNPEAIFTIQDKDIYDHNTQNYYELITQVADSLSSVNYLQYSEEDGRVIIRSLKDQSLNKLRHDIENTNILGNNSKYIISNNYEEFQIKPYEMKIKYTEFNKHNIIEGIEYTIKNNNDEFQIFYDLASNSVNVKLNGNNVNDLNVLSSLVDMKNFQQFIDDQLHLNIVKDHEYLDAIKIIIGGVTQYNGSQVFEELMRLSSEVYLNKYVSNVLLKDSKGYKSTISILKTYYTQEELIPSYNKTYNEINLFSQRQLPILEHLASAKTIVTGEAQSAQVRDAEGNMLSSQTLSRLLGNIMSQWENIRELDNQKNIIHIDKNSKSYNYKGKQVIFGPVVDSKGNIRTKNGVSIGASVDRNTGIITFDLEVLYNKFKQKSWQNPAKQNDDSYAYPLPKDLFANFDQFITFVLEHEYQHTLHPQLPGETSGHYETRINNYALSNLNFGTPASNFSLLTPNVYTGFYTAKELKTPYGSKEHTKFTVAESIQSNFLYDFVGGFVKNNKESIIGNGKIGLLPSVNSDKNTIGRIILNLKANINNKTFEELNENELIKIIQEELGNAYQTSYSNIISDYKTLQMWLYDTKGIDVEIDPSDNFSELNNYCYKLGKNTKSLLCKWTNEYNNSYHQNGPTNIKLIENVHYTERKVNILGKSFKQIKFNGTFQALMNRLSNIRSLKQFIHLKESELLKTLLDENVIFDLQETLLKVNENTSKSWLKSNYPEWVNKKFYDLEGNLISSEDNDVMVLAKITYNGITYDITNKSDLLDLNQKLKINILSHPHHLCIIPGISFELHPMLKKYNLFDFLFTQEYMISGVGSHIAHKSKAENNKLAVWKPKGVINTKLKIEDVSSRIINYDESIERILFNYINQNVQNASNQDLTQQEIIINSAEFKEYAKNILNKFIRKAQLDNKVFYTSLDFFKDGFESQFSRISNDSNDGLDNELIETINYEMLEESQRFLAQHKRNVSYTAAMHEFQREQINGIPSQYNMAMMEDIKAHVYTNSGDFDSATPFDGATFVNPWVIEWENNSLKGDKAGIDKKQFVHYYDPKTGTGGIIKTAGFGVTNDRVRRYKFYRNMIYNMTKRIWKNSDGSTHIVRDGGILIDYNGKSVNYGPIYFKKGKHYYMREIISYEGNNTYKCEITEIDKFGSPLSETNEELISNVESNYDIWQMFGGYNSLEFNSSDELQFSEKSRILTAQACNNYGIIKLGVQKVRTAQDLNQPMKHSDIHYMPTEGAVKQGLGNINSKDCFFKRGTLDFIQVDMRQAGIQLDKEHQADNAKLSLMTQVISAACAKGYSKKQATALYNALYQLSKLSTYEFRNEMGDLLFLEDEDSKKQFDDAITNIIMKDMINSTSQDGDMVKSIAKDIIYKIKTEKTLSKEDALNEVNKVIPYSDPSIFNKIITSVTVALTKSGIKAKMPGVLSVLCPAHEIIKFYKIPVLNENGEFVFDDSGKIKYKKVTYDKLEDYFDTQDEESCDDIQNQQSNLLQNFTPEVNVPYLLTYRDGSQKLVNFGDDLNLSGKYKNNYFHSETILDLNLDNLDKIQKWVRPKSIEDQLDELQSKEPIITEVQNHLEVPGIHNIEIGYKYLITYSDGHQQVVHVVTPQAYNNNKLPIEFKGKLINYSEIGYQTLKNSINDITSIQEWNRNGQDLKSYNVHFQDVEGNTYQLADLDIVQDYFKVKQIKDPISQINFILQLVNKYNKFEEFSKRLSLIKESYIQKESYPDSITNLIDLIINREYSQLTQILNDYKYSENCVLFMNFIRSFGLKFLNRQLQINLNGISKNGNTDEVIIDGNLVKINKSSVDISSYGLIMPKTCKSNLGLDDFDSVEDIKNDPQFFTKKLIKKFTTKVEITKDLETGELISPFHLELKRSDGNHIYIRQGKDKSGLSDTEIKWFKRVDSNGDVFRVNVNNEIMYQMSSPDDKIYRDVDGNEIIVIPNEDYWVDINGKKVTKLLPANLTKLGENGYFDEKSGDTYFKKSSLQFYLDNMNYNSINISRACTQDQFYNILNMAKDSSNKYAVKFADMILNKGKDLKDEKQKYTSRKKLSDKLNNYEVLLEDEELKNYAMKHLQELGNEMYTSFLQMLNIIAARIPSQNQQSFMSMQVEEFDNPDINTAYVSIFQFYLQGSDLDIDAVSLQTFELDRNGIFIGHSPYYNLSNPKLKKISENIPFPTGKKLELTEVNDINDSTIKKITSEIPNIFGIKNKFPESALILFDPRSDKDVKFKLNINSEENMKNLINLINILNDGIFSCNNENLKIANIINYLFQAKYSNLNGQLVIAEHISKLNDFLLNIINNHNLYILNSSQNKREGIIKNYVTTQLFNIISDPKNLIEAQSSVDVVTGPAKELAKSSPKATVQNTFTPGNVGNKFQSISENMVGKDGIAICATGLKSYFALTQIYSQMLSGEYNSQNYIPKDLKDLLLFNVTIGGRTYHGLANGFTDKFLSKYEENDVNQLDYFGNELENYLLDQLWAADAANDMSALLGLSVDNAKELILAKMNAGTSSIGMYLYGLSIGMSFDDLYKIMTSPLAFRLTELTKGNSFNHDEGTFNFLGALNYLNEEPLLDKFNNVDPELNVITPSNLFKNKLQAAFHIDVEQLSESELKVFSKGIIQFLIWKYPKQEILSAIKSLRNEYLKEFNSIDNLISRDNYKISYNKVLDFTEQFINDVFLTKENVKYRNVYGVNNLYYDIQKLSEGAEEMKLIGKILRLNQEIKTNPTDLIQQVQNIETCIQKRFNVLRKYAKRNHLSDAQMRKIYPEYSSFIKTETLKLNFEKFITDDNYAQEQINIYNKFKCSFNPLLILKQDPKYKGYSETLYNAYKGLKSKSVKMNYIIKRGEDFRLTYKVSDSKLQEQINKNIENQVDLITRQLWLQSSSLNTLVIPASNKTSRTFCFIENIAQATELKYNREIKLGTDIGDANFKLWVETSIIPQLKNNPSYLNNKFIQDLSPIINTRTLSGNNMLNFGLTINMMPKSDYERDVFNEYKEDLNKLQYEAFIDGSGKAYSLLDIMYVYSLICNNGKLGPRSLHSIFEDQIDGDLQKSYRNFISEKDRDKDYIKFLDEQISDVLIAPKASPYQGGSNLLKWKNSDTGKMDIWEIPMEEDNEDPSNYYEDNFDEQVWNIGDYINTTSNYFSQGSENYFYSLKDVKTGSQIQVNTVDDKKYPLSSNFIIKFEVLPGSGRKKPSLGFIKIDPRNNNKLSKEETKEIIDKFNSLMQGNKSGELVKIIIDSNNNVIPTINQDKIESDLNALKCI